MTSFSDDGQWWWDGRQWTPSSQVVIPDLPEARTDKALRLIERRAQIRAASGVGVALMLPAGIWQLVWLPYLIIELRFFHAYRRWVLELLSSATTYLLGPDEPLVAAEPNLRTQFLGANPIPDLSVVVTAAHVLVLHMDYVNGQPRSIALAARAGDVHVQSPTPFFSQPTIVVHRGLERWSIHGSPGVMRREPVVSAWKRAAAGVTR